MSGPSNQKPKLTVVVGAGGSVELGVPSTAALLDTTSAALRARPAIVSSGSSMTLGAVVDLLLKRCKDYYGDDFNFEYLLHVLEALGSVRGSMAASANGSRLVEVMFADGLHADLRPALDGYFTSSAPRAFFSALHDAISVASADARRHPNWTPFAEMWRALDAEFELSIATMNYDTLIEQALGWGPQDQGFEAISGELSWRFRESVLRACPRLVHLHGSIHFGYRTDSNNRFAYEDDWEDLYWWPTPRQAEQSIGARSSHASQAGRACIKGPLITGLNKPDKLLVEPYGAYLRTLADQLIQAPRLLVIGYGYGDLHVNALLQRLVKNHGDVRVAAISWFDPIEMHGSWGLARGAESMMAQMWSRDDEILDQMDYTQPIVSANGQVQIYYKGLVDVARSHVQAMIDFLK